MGGPADQCAAGAAQEDNRFEIRLLHERVNSLLAAEAFLTIAYTATMGSSGRWVAVVAPVLSVLGLLLAAVAWPGVRATSRLVVLGTARLGEVLERNPQFRPRSPGSREDQRRRDLDQRRSLLFIRAAPLMLGVVWLILLACSLFLRG